MDHDGTVAVWVAIVQSMNDTLCKDVPLVGGLEVAEATVSRDDQAPPLRRELDVVEVDGDSWTVVDHARGIVVTDGRVPALLGNGDAGPGHLVYLDVKLVVVGDKANDSMTSRAAPGGADNKSQALMLSVPAGKSAVGRRG